MFVLSIEVFSTIENQYWKDHEHHRRTFWLRALPGEQGVKFKALQVQKLTVTTRPALGTVAVVQSLPSP